MLITQVLSGTGNRLTRFAALMSLLSLSYLPLAQAGELAPALPPGTTTIEETHYPPAAPGVAAPKLPASSSRPSAEDMVDAARRDIGKIDHELRKDSPPPKEPAAAATKPSMQQTLEKALATPAEPHAAKPGETTMEEITRPDGQRVTKVTGPNGTYCVTQISVGNTKGEDIMQKGAVSRTTSCGAPF
jgi:hypothetical protein